MHQGLRQKDREGKKNKGLLYANDNPRENDVAQKLRRLKIKVSSKLHFSYCSHVDQRTASAKTRCSKMCGKNVDVESSWIKANGLGSFQQRCPLTFSMELKSWECSSDSQDPWTLQRFHSSVKQNWKTNDPNTVKLTEATHHYFPVLLAVISLMSDFYFRNHRLFDIFQFKN